MQQLMAEEFTKSGNSLLRELWFKGPHRSRILQVWHSEPSQPSNRWLMLSDCNIDSIAKLNLQPIRTSWSAHCWISASVAETNVVDLKKKQEY